MIFRVLSIDGGGMRGIYSAAYLDALEQSFSKKRNLPQGLDVGKGFKLIVGTSTGAIIGCGLAKGVQSAEIVKLYEKWGAAIFPKKMPKALTLDLAQQMFTRPQYLKRGDEALTQALKEALGDMTVGQLWRERNIALAVPSVNMSNYNGWVFKTPHDPKSNHRDDDYTLVDVCRASSAAPLFRSLAAVNRPKDKEFNVFADGGLWANNPVIVSLLEALRISADHEDTDIEIFCLGSCGKPEGESVEKTALHRGLAEWKFGGEAAKVSIAAQESAFDEVANKLIRYLNKKVRIIRFPTNKIPGSMLQFLDLDETRPQGLLALISQARTDADKTNSDIQYGKNDGPAIESLFNDVPERGRLP